MRNGRHENKTDAAPARTPVSVKSLLAPLASLRLTIVLFSLSIVLVFFGTLALINASMWTIINSYFRSFVTWIEFDLIRQFLTVFFFYPKDSPPWHGSFPFPGGITIAVALLVNMITAHAVRFKFKSSYLCLRQSAGRCKSGKSLRCDLEKKLATLTISMTIGKANHA